MAFGLLMSGFSIGNLIGFIAAGVLPRPGHGKCIKLILIGVLMGGFGAVVVALGFISVDGTRFLLFWPFWASATATSPY